MHVAESTSASSAAPQSAPAKVAVPTRNPWTREDLLLAARFLRPFADPRIGVARFSVARLLGQIITTHLPVAIERVAQQMGTEVGRVLYPQGYPDHGADARYTARTLLDFGQLLAGGLALLPTILAVCQTHITVRDMPAGAKSYYHPIDPVPRTMHVDTVLWARGIWHVSGEPETGTCFEKPDGRVEQLEVGECLLFSGGWGPRRTRHMAPDSAAARCIAVFDFSPGTRHATASAVPLHRY